ncbi:hypothetical protein HID58_070260, partial [Brassica napus]
VTSVFANMNSHSLWSIDGGNTPCSSSSLSPLHNFLNLHPTETTTTSFQFKPSRHFSNGSFSRSSAFCNLSSSSSSDTQKHLGTTLPFLSNPSTERSPAAASFSEEDLLSIPYEEEVDTSFLSLHGDGGLQDLDNFSLSEEQMALQFLSDELQLAITDRAQTPRLDEIYQVTGSKATPKAVMKMMSVEGLTIYQVKSHLQKYRIAKHMPERKEEKKSGGNPEEKKPASNTNGEANGRKKGAIQLTEALRMQMEVQKQLHQQLEVQRSLQLRIEEHAKYLEKILDEQRKSTSKQDDECETSLKRPRLEN